VLEDEEVFSCFIDELGPCAHECHRRVCVEKRALLLQPIGEAQVARVQSCDVFVAATKDFSEPGIAEDIPKSTVTFENVAGWSWGSSFLFVGSFAGFFGGGGWGTLNLRSVSTMRVEGGS